MQFSKLLPRLLAMSLLLAPLGAIAQPTGGIYAAFSTTSLSTSGSPRFNGGTLGGFAEWGLKGSFNSLCLGGDARFSIARASQPNTGFGFNPSGTSLGYDTYVIGPEVSFKTHITPLRPYAEVLFGGAHASANVSGGFVGYIPGVNDAVSKNYGMVSFVGGADWKILKNLAWRVVEIDYGKFNGISSTTISTGLVLRLP